MRWLIILSLASLIILVVVVVSWIPARMDLPPKEEPAVSEVLEDNIWRAEVKTWIDQNENGKIEESELPLSGVTVHFQLYDASDYIRVETKATDDNGRARLSVSLPGRPQAKFHIYVDSIPNYTLTTSNRISTSTQGIVLFGFKHLKNLD